MIPGVSYDAEIEYLESTGTQYIDTGIVPSYLHSAICTFQLRSPLDTSSDSSGCLFGCFRSWGNAGWAPVFVLQRNEIFNSWGNSFQLRRNIPFPQNTDKWNTITFGAGYTDVFGLRIGPNTNVSAPQHTAFVFCCNYNGNTWGVGTAKRISSFQIYNGSSLILDFIPVRVGQTGYMYDRVSKRLFGNQGTGSFVLGPDVAKPVIGLYGMKQITYVPSDYVTNGIVAWYDGEWNAGWNNHDANAQVWKDLSGEGNDATIVKRDTFDRSFTFDSNSCTMDGTFCWSFTASNSVINAVKGDCTIEVIRKLGTPSIQDSTPFFGLNVYNSRAMSMSGTSASCKLRMGMNNEFHANNSTTPGISTTITKHIEGTTVSTIFFEKGIQRGTGTYSTQAITVNSDGVLFGAGTNLFGGEGRYWHPSPPSDGHAYTLRFYSRALSTAEIAHNYAIDKARFNLP